MSYGTIIIGSLNDKELMSAINKLAKDVNKKMGDESSGSSTVVGAFASGIKVMEDRLVKFSQNANKTVDSIKKTFTDLGTTYDELAKAMQKAANVDLSALEAKRVKAGAKEAQGKPTTSFELEQLNAYYRELERVSALEAKRTKNEETIRRRGYADRLTSYGRMPEGDLTNAEDKLRKLLALKNDLRKDPLLSLSQMQQLDNRIQKTINKVRELRAALVTSNTPTMGGVMGMSENTLDEIARKMQAIKGLRAGLNYQTQAGDINRLNAEYTRLNQLQSQILGQNLRIGSSNNALARSFGYIRNRIVYALTLGAATSFVKQLYDIRGQYELLERSLGALTNSFQKGSQIFQELNEMAIKSPFTLMELAGAAKQLTAYNFSANEVVDTTRRLADISAALGVPMERLTYNLGQIRAQTVLTARDARDFANAGLPMVKSLADYYSELEGRVVSTGDVYERMSKKMVSYNDVMAVLSKMTDEGGRFFNFQAKQADTLRVQIANLDLAWNNMLNEMGQSNQDFLALPIKSARALFQNWREINRILTDVAVVIGLVKTAQIALNLALGKGNAAIKSQILLNKQKKAIDLDKKALTEQLTVSEERLRATRNSLTAADYHAALAGRNLTKQQALLMVSLDRNNMALKKALVQLNILTAAEIRSANAGTILKTAFQSLGLALKGLGATLLSSLPMLAVTAAIGGIVHLVQQYSDNAERLKEMNEGLAESAKESADSLEKFLSNKGYRAAREMANNNNLSPEKGEHVWDAISEELKTSALSADTLLMKLTAISDVNERVGKGFDYLEKVKEAAEVLKGVDENSIIVTQDFFLTRGLATQARVFAEELQKVKGSIGDFNSYIEKGGGSTQVFQAQFHAYQKELEITANSINDYIKEHNVTDPLQINEIIEQAKAIIRAKNPEIKGDIAKMIDIDLDKKLYELTGKASDATAGLWKLFREELRKHQGAFSNITDDIYDETKKLSLAQNKAIDEALQSLKDSFPQYKDEIAGFLADVSTMRANIGITFHVEKLGELQADFKKKFLTPSMILDNDKFEEEVSRLTSIYGEFNQRNEESFVEWEKRLQDELKKTTEALEIQQRVLAELNKELSGQSEEQKNADARYVAAKKTIELLQKRAETLKEVMSYEKMIIEIEKNSGSSGKNRKDRDEDGLSAAIRKEIEIITNMQKRYKEYMKIGVGSTEAITKATEEYGKSLAIVNKKLRELGLSTLTNSEIAKKPIQEIRDFYIKQLNEISNVIKKVSSITYDASKEEMSEIEGVSKLLLQQTKLFEGFVDSVYEDEAGVKTIGYGHSAMAPTIDKNPIVDGMTLTQDEAHKILIDDYKAIKAAVDSTIDQYSKSFESLETMTASQYEALLDFTYQHGAGTLKKLLNYAQGDIKKIGEVLGDTTLIGIKNWAGSARREWRQAMFEGRTFTIDENIKKEVEELVKSGKGIEALEKAIATINVEITKDNYKTIIEGLNSELGKIKEEYELGVELDASPELGQAFADIFKIDIDQLPRTVYDAFRHVEHAVQGGLSSLGIKDSFNVMTDNLEDFTKKYERDLGSDFISAIKKIQDTIRGMWKKETSDTIKDWNNLLNKYGDFQTKLMKISKDSAKEQLSIIKRFGSTEDKGEAQIIVDNISISQDPEQIEILRKQLLDILNRVVNDKDVAIKIKTASSKEEGSLISKAYWEDFKNSELYSMTFEEMDRVSTRAIKSIIEQLDMLKDKVKEDPASMKALMDAYKKGRDELEKRSPFMAIGESLKEWAAATKEVKTANEAYAASIKEMNDAEEEYQKILERNNMLQSMGQYGVSAEDLEETADAQEKLNKAKEKAKKNQQNLTSAENEEISAQTKFRSALKNSASALQSMGGALSTITELMGIAEDSELGVMVNSLIVGFQTMATVLGLVATMAELAQLSLGWIGLVMIALSALIALVSYLTKMPDIRINEQLKESELIVKRLENSYKELEATIEDTYGTEGLSLESLAIANKKLQLAELERQLTLEESRRSKSKDEDKIEDIKGQVIDLKNEIKKAQAEIVSELLNTNSVSDAAENFMSDFINALREGEDAMQVFNDGIDDMIANMVMKLYSSKILSPWFENTWKKIEDDVADRSEAYVKQYQDALKAYNNAMAWKDDSVMGQPVWAEAGFSDQEEYIQYYKNKLDDASEALAKNSEITISDIEKWAELLREGQGVMEGGREELLATLERLGLIKSQTSQNLSNLTQGIEGITESTAESINAYLNGISQQVYLENSQLAEIKEYISNFNFDIQLGVLSEILLQLQTSYQTQNAIQSILQGWSNADGMAVRVELQ